MVRLGIAFIIVAMITGCSYGPYRTNDNFCKGNEISDCRSSMVSELGDAKTPSFYFGVVEYDDQGMVQNPARYLADGTPKGEAVVTEQIRQLSSNQELPLMLIVFTHGFNHNASFDKKSSSENGNVQEFKKLLEKSAVRYKGKYNVMGVYASWRGRVWPNFTNYIRFYGRKDTAHKVGALGLSNTLLRYESIVKASSDTRNKMVTIGHSFGGAAVYSAVQQVLAERYIGSRNSNKEGIVDGFGDLVVLMNPAFESMMYASLFELAQDNCRSYSSKQMPKFVIVNSSGDGSVRILFNMLRAPFLLLNSYQVRPVVGCSEKGLYKFPFSERAADRIAIGHHRALVTHVMDEQGHIKNTYNSAVAADPRKGISNIDFDTKANSISELGRSGVIRVNDSEKISSRDVVIVKKNNTMPYNPFMNVFTTDRVLSGHNDIWNDKVSLFIERLIFNVGDKDKSSN